MKLERRHAYHVLFWLVYFIFNVIRWGSYFDDYVYSFQSNLVEFPIHIILAYTNIYFLLPRYIKHRSFPKYLTFLLSFVFLMSITRILLNYALVTTEIWPESERSDVSLFDFNYIVNVFVGELYVVGTTSAVWFAVEKVRETDLREKLEERRLRAELAYLKSQIQPHFFFNTLNSLYSLALEKSDHTPTMILKLSKIMNFVIYRGKESELPLIEIVSHINNYLELEKVRFQDALEVNFEISGDLEGVYLAPLILSSFVENAVKHGAPDEDRKVRIDISLEVISKEIVKFSIRNKKDTSSRKAEKEHTGLGLINATKTLDLQYGESYDLAVEDSGDHFEVKLQVACGK